MKCRICQRVLRKRFDGPCRYVMELEPGVFKRCNLERNAPVDPIDPHTWDGGHDHLRTERVEFAIVVDATGVTMTVAHLDRYHPEWAKPQAGTRATV